MDPTSLCHFFSLSNGTFVKKTEKPHEAVLTRLPLVSLSSNLLVFIDWLIRSFCIKLLKSKKLSKKKSLFWEISHVQCWPRAKSTYFQCEFAM